MLQQVLEDDASFLMGHVLVGASQCLAPLIHQDALDAATRLQVATTIAQEGEKTKLCTCIVVHYCNTLLSASVVQLQKR